MAIRFYNSLTRKLEEFTPLRSGEVRMYNCGPTVYSSPHIGNFRTFLLAELLRRFLDWKGFKVTQVMNLTDVGHLQHDDADEGEDKIELASRREKLTAWQIAERYIQEFADARQYLNVRPAHEYPRATDHIREMIVMIEDMVKNGYAYMASTGNVYFAIDKFPAYGLLSGNTAEELKAGARVEPNPEKRDPRDFALWKTDSKHQMQWDSPWGRGFPGWHIECSAMSRKYLGDTLDIHTGGEDNVFPHHECEIAQSESVTHRPFVRYWLHARHLLVDNQKMSKSLGNFFTVGQLKEEGFSGEALRLALMRVHYREKLNFTRAGLEEAERKIRRYRDLETALGEGASKPGVPTPEAQEFCARARAEFDAALSDDLNISVACAVLDGLVSEGFRRQPQGADATQLLSCLLELSSVLGLLEAKPAAEELGDPEIDRLMEERNQARLRKDFKAADAVRDLLKSKGIELLDTKDGVRWRRIRQ